MDPKACLLRLLNALSDEDRDDAIESCNDLGRWLAGGGFFPDAEDVCEEFLESIPHAQPELPEMPPDDDEI